MAAELRIEWGMLGCSIGVEQTRYMNVLTLACKHSDAAKAAFKLTGVTQRIETTGRTVKDP
jgi:hypothetical protein